MHEFIGLVFLPLAVCVKLAVRDKSIKKNESEIEILLARAGGGSLREVALTPIRSQITAANG